MRRLLLVPFLALAALLLFAPTQLRADGFDSFTFSETVSGLGDVSIVWQLPATPDPASPDFSSIPGAFGIANVPATLTILGVATPAVGDFGFFDSSFGFEFLSNVGGFSFALSGANTMFSGGESNPTFISGTYSGVDPFSVDGSPATLSIVSTPEPSSLLMLLTGFLALAGALAVKKAAA